MRALVRMPRKSVCVSFIVATTFLLAMSAGTYMGYNALVANEERVIDNVFQTFSSFVTEQIQEDMEIAFETAVARSRFLDTLHGVDFAFAQPLYIAINQAFHDDFIASLTVSVILRGAYSEAQMATVIQDYNAINNVTGTDVNRIDIDGTVGPVDSFPPAIVVYMLSQATTITNLLLIDVSLIRPNHVFAANTDNIACSPPVISLQDGIPGYLLSNRIRSLSGAVILQVGGLLFTSPVLPKYADLGMCLRLIDATGVHNGAPVHTLSTFIQDTPRTIVLEELNRGCTWKDTFDDGDDDISCFHVLSDAFASTIKHAPPFDAKRRVCIQARPSDELRDALNTSMPSLALGIMTTCIMCVLAIIIIIIMSFAKKNQIMLQRTSFKHESEVYKERVGYIITTGMVFMKYAQQVILRTDDNDELCVQVRHVQRVLTHVLDIANDVIVRVEYRELSMPTLVSSLQNIASNIIVARSKCIIMTSRNLDHPATFMVDDTLVRQLMNILLCNTLNLTPFGTRANAAMAMQVVDVQDTMFAKEHEHVSHSRKLMLVCMQSEGRAHTQHIMEQFNTENRRHISSMRYKHNILQPPIGNLKDCIRSTGDMLHDLTQSHDVQGHGGSVAIDMNNNYRKVVIQSVRDPEMTHHWSLGHEVDITNAMVIVRALNGFIGMQQTLNTTLMWFAVPVVKMK